MTRSCTRLRMSVMARCAATPRICDKRKRRRRLHERRRAGGQRQRQQQLRATLADDFVDEPFGGGGQHQAREPADQHQPQAEAEPPPVRPHELLGLAPGGRGRHSLFFRHRFHGLCGPYRITADTLASGHHPKVQVRHTITNEPPSTERQPP